MTTKTLEEKILALEKRFCNCCKVLPTTNGIPTGAPTNGQTVKIDLSTGIIYYYDSDTNTWEVLGGDTNFFSANLTQDSGRTHDAAGFDTVINNQGQFEININTASGSAFRVNNVGDGFDGDSSYFDVQKERASLSTTNAFEESSVFLDQGVSLVNSDGKIFLSDGGAVYDNPPEDNTKDAVVVLDTTTGRVYLRDVSTIGGSGALPYYEAILRIEDVLGDLQVTEEITNTFPGAVWETNTPSSSAAQGGFEIRPTGYGFNFAFSDTPNLGPQNNMTYAADGTVIQFSLYGNGLDNIGILPSLLTATITTPSNTAFVGHNFIMTIRHYI